MRRRSGRWIGRALAAGLVAVAALGTPSGRETPAGETGRSGAAEGDGRTRRLARDFRSTVEVLASDRMEGRGLGTAGIRRAADWIEERLRAFGLEPAFEAGFRQPFQVKTGVTPGAGNRLEGIAEGDWVPLGFSSSGEFSGEIAFAGYGIEAPTVGYRELEEIDLHGRVALMLRYEPQEKDEASPFDGKRPSRWSALRYKVLQARERGAAAVIFATGPLQDEGKDKLPVLQNDGPESPAGIPVIQVKTSVARRWLDGIGLDLRRFQEAVDRDLAPRSVESTGIRVAGRVALKTTYTSTENLAGMIPGQGALAKEVVVLGAHYDHLGFGGQGSMRPNERAIHNGADDNASGTAVVLLAGRELRKDLVPVESRRTLVVALFSGEEVGLAGSSHFVAHPPFPLDRIVAMINLDMVGRLRDGRLVALGSESAPEWTAAIERAAAASGLDVTSRGDGYGPSDQTSFYAAGIPVLHLFTGAHDAYHTPDDKPATVDPEGAARVTALTMSLAGDLARGTTRPTYARSTSGPVMGGDSRGYGAYLGTVPDYRALESAEGGVLLADVRAAGPAELAGIRGGDRIVEMAGTRIENLYDMTYALQDHRPGETVEVVVERKGERLRLRATLGDRSKMGRESGEAKAAPARAASHAAVPVPSTPGEAPKETAIAPFYEGRPGADFVVGAGKPFGRSFESERHFREIRQLTFGGENAEAYFSPDGRHVVYQATPREGGCDQQYLLDLASGATRRVSTGKGRTTCGYYDWPEADRILFASTHGASDACPPPPDRSQGYVWALYDSFDLYEARPDGSGLRRLTDAPGYDAEATWCHRGGGLVFTSTRDGDPELYAMDEAGATRRLTHAPGYDGGAFYSPDCSEIVWRASRPQGAELEEYRRLLANGLIRPHSLELYLMKAEGGDARQLTANGAANFCPTFHPDGRRILYSSNAGSENGREFDLWILDKGGGEPERVTFAPGFDGFPHLSPDGRWIVWSSNRADPASRETNLYIAKWVD